MWAAKEKEEEADFIDDFKEHFRPGTGIKAIYRFQIDEKEETLIIEVDGAQLNCYYGTVTKADVDIKVNNNTMKEILLSKMTFQRAFMSGAMKTKGDFRILRTLDQLFLFEQKK